VQASKSSDPTTKAAGLNALKSQAYIRNCLQIIAQSFTKDSSVFGKVSP
jgi:hypothetical protein